MEYEILSERYEFTQTVRLSDEAPVTLTSKGLKFQPSILGVLWIKENADAWEFMGTELRGKRIKEDGTLGVTECARSFWVEIKDLPEWIRDIVEDMLPYSVITERAL